MFPLRAVHKPQSPPFITRLLITINIVVFVARYLPGELGNWARVGDLWRGVQPNCYFSPSACGIELSTRSSALWQPIFGAMFLHAGILHLAFNMLFLSVFGAGVEEKLGKLRFVAFYFLCGIAATVAQLLANPLSDSVLLGASGAIAGVLGASFILQPRAWILTYFPPIFLFPLPAALFLLLWFAAQIVSQVSPLWNRVLDIGFVAGNGVAAAPVSDNKVAWMAHIGGFVTGALWAWTISPWWKKRALKE